MARVIKNKAGEVVTDAKVLSEYFGKKPGQQLSEFYAELKALKPEDKEELVIGAAKELGWSVES